MHAVFRREKALKRDASTHRTVNCEREVTGELWTDKTSQGQPQCKETQRQQGWAGEETDAWLQTALGADNCWAWGIIKGQES